MISDLREAAVWVAEAADATAIIQFAAGVRAH
jgi:hypothetical protein